MGLRGCEEGLDANNSSGISKEEWLIPWKFGWEGVGVATRETKEGRVKLSVQGLVSQGKEAGEWAFQVEGAAWAQRCELV